MPRISNILLSIRRLIITSAIGLHRHILTHWMIQLMTQISSQSIESTPSNHLGLTLVPVEPLKRKQRQALIYLSRKFGTKNLGDYLEFGVYNGTSLSCLYQVLQDLGLNQMRLFGFDSFEGLPEAATNDDEAGIWKPGDFKFNYELTWQILSDRGIDWNRVFLIKGWFSDTLTTNLIQHYQIEKASIIMVDCDLYASAKEVLSFCAPLIQEQTIIFFDDWRSSNLFPGKKTERHAFDEFLAENPEFTIEEFGSYSATSLSFIVSRQLFGSQKSYAKSETFSLC